MIVMRYDIATEEEWVLVGGKIRYHVKPICDVLFISQALAPTCSNQGQHSKPKQSVPTSSRLISLAQDRVSSFLY
jgi:hypothetical protein